MTGAKKLNQVSVEEYLEGEQWSPIKHEYVGGSVYAMATAHTIHSMIASNTLNALGSRLRGGPCRVFNSDTKIRLRMRSEVRFYYPDASVCRKNALGETFQDDAAVVVEVLSQRTRRIDEVEKKDAYLTIPSLEVYILVEQEAPLVVVWRRSERGFLREEYHGLDAVIRLGEVDAIMPLAEIYYGVEFVPEAE